MLSCISTGSTRIHVNCNGRQWRVFVAHSNARSVAYLSHGSFALTFAGVRNDDSFRALLVAARTLPTAMFLYSFLASKPYGLADLSSQHAVHGSACSVFCTIIDDAPRFLRTSTAISCRFRHSLELSLFGNRHSLCFHIRWYSEEIADSRCVPIMRRRVPAL